MSKPFSIVAILMLMGLCALHAVQVASGQPLIIGGGAVPLLGSVIAIVAMIAVAIGLWVEAFGGTDDAPSTGPATTRGASRGMTRGKGAPVWEANGQRLPAEYFMFASRGVSVKSIRGAAEKYERIMVGFDAGNIPEATHKAAVDVGAELEIYVEGPGGPTGNSWSSDERARVKRASAKVGIDTGRDNWMKEWDNWGWKAYSFMQLEEYMNDGYSAGEIDNLSRVLGEGVPKLIEFYQEYGERVLAGHLPRLIMKNISVEQLQAVVAAVESGDLPREMFSEFHISEKGAGFNRKKQDEVSAKIAVRTVPSNDTFNYDAYGEFGLSAQFAKLMPPAAPAVEDVQPAAPATVAATAGMTGAAPTTS